MKKLCISVCLASFTLAAAAQAFIRGRGTFSDGSFFVSHESQEFPLDTNARACFTFEYDQGTNYIDFSISIKTNNCQQGIAGMLPMYSKQDGGYLDFDGVNDGIDGLAGAVYRMNAAEPLTFMAWVRPKDTNDSGDYIYFSGDTTGTGPGLSAVSFAIRNTGGFYRMQYIYSANNAAYQLWSGAPVEENIWQHITIALDRAGGAANVTNKANMYINGSPVGIVTNSAPIGDSMTFNTWFSLGYIKLATNGHFDGKLDGIRVYQVKLNPTEITNIFRRSEELRGL